MADHRAPRIPVVPRRRFLAAVGTAGGVTVAGCAGGGDDRPGTASGTPTQTARATTTAPRSTTAATATPAPERRFDFLDGAWTVSDATGEPVGSSVVRTHSAGNLLLEEWSGADGRSAAGMTYYDFAAATWAQARVDDRGTLVEVEGGHADGAMRLTGRRVRPDGTERPLRRTYTADGDGAVRVRTELSSDGGDTWDPGVDWTYERRGDAGAEDPPTAAPSRNAGADPATLPPGRRFDFWVGTWDVHRPRGTVVVRNVIQSRLDGHLLIEHWDGAGLVGKSFNYRDRSAGWWSKRWVPDNGNKVVMTGGYRDGAMRLEGTLSFAHGEAVGHRASFTPNDDGTVIQRIQLSRDGGVTWGQPWEGVYVRADA